MEHELLMTGIGGQGVQLASQVLARAALSQGLHVQLFGSYEGMMRGGSTQATLVLSDGPVESPPTVHQAASAMVLHHEHAAAVLSAVRPGGLVLVNSTVVEGPAGGPDVTVVAVPATDLAIEAGHVMASSMVMAGAFAARTRLLDLESLRGAVEASLPPYRRRHIELNRQALDRGYRHQSNVAA